MKACCGEYGSAVDIRKNRIIVYTKHVTQVGRVKYKWDETDVDQIGPNINSMGPVFPALEVV